MICYHLLLSAFAYILHVKAFCLSRYAFLSRSFQSRLELKKLNFLLFAVIVKPFQVKVEDQDVFGPGGTATFTCIYPPEVSSYVRIRKWFADKEPQEAEPSGNLVISDVQESHSKKLYYCVIVNILTKETLASNVAKISIRNALGNCYVILFSCIANLILLLLSCVNVLDRIAREKIH